MEAPRNDGQMFQRWASAVSEIPTDDAQAFARDKVRAVRTLARAETPAGPTITLTADEAGLRPAMSINVVDALELPNARDMGLRTAMSVADSVMGDRQPARVERTSLRTQTPSAQAAGAWTAQLAAFRTRADAEATWRKLKAANASVLGGVTPRYETVDLGSKGTWVRLRTSPLPSQAAADAVCRAAGVTDRWCAKASA